MPLLHPDPDRPLKGQEKLDYDAKIQYLSRHFRTWGPEEFLDELLKISQPEGLPVWAGEEQEANYLARLREAEWHPEEFWAALAAHPGYLVPTTTGPLWVVGPGELVCEAVGHSSLTLRLWDGSLMAMRPVGIALAETGPARLYRFLGAARRNRAGWLWTPSPKGRR